MFLMILFDPDYVTVNSIPYWLDPASQSIRPLTPGKHRPSRKRSSQIVRPTATISAAQHKGQVCSYDGVHEVQDQEKSFINTRLHISSCSETIQDNSNVTAKVHFTLPHPLDVVSKYSNRRALVFTDPFLEHNDDNRRISTSSTSSELIPRGAFAYHKDTFGRLLKARDEENEDIENAASLTSTNSNLFHRHEMFVHRDTLALLHYKQNLTIALPDQVLSIIARYLDRTDYRNLRLTCRRWAENLPRPSIGVAQQIPNEILLQIFGLLSLPDYDAARHTCKWWFIVALDFKLASSILRCSGLQSAFLRDLEQEQLKILNSRSSRTSDDTEVFDTDADKVNHEWLVAKRLATECRLSGFWRGSGMRTDSGHSLTNFTVTEIMDFSKLLDRADIPLTHKSYRSFTVSACSKYLLVVVGNTIFVFGLSSSGPSVSLNCRLIASRGVIAVSMDTSSGRNSVAALLEGRLGVLWDLHRLQSCEHAISQDGEALDLGLRMDIQSCRTTDAMNTFPARNSSTSFKTPAESSPSLSIVQDENIESLHGTVSYRTESPETMPPWLWRDHEHEPDLEASFSESDKSPRLVETVTSPTAQYTKLGTANDAPLSVAICPQRKCVAFGCVTGIELHWVDNTTATNLNRWFPLAAPSDYLFFLPQRPDVDSTKKLRLISSAAGSLQNFGERRDSITTKWRFRSSNTRHGRLQSMTRLFFGSLPFPSALSRTNSFSQPDNDEARGILRTVDCDHYAATPLSDGSHVLFTDPATGLLCLGSDAPLGGPTKLMRKVCMVPPASDSPEKATALVCYRSGSDMRWGVRVVAAYDDGRVVLYNIPVDCFERIRHIRSTPNVWDELAGVVGQSDLLMDVFMTNQQDTSNDNESEIEPNLMRQRSNSSATMSFRSLQIDGSVIYKANSGVEDLQVDCTGGGVKVWLFFRNMSAVRLSVYTPRNFQPDTLRVNDDGTICDRSGSFEEQREQLDVEATAQDKGKCRASDVHADMQDEYESLDKRVKFVLYN